MPASIVGPAGWTLAGIGLAGIGIAVGAKLAFERSSHGQLAACEKRLDLIRSQIRQAEEDRDALDARLPGAAASGRLAAAEKELAALEALAPLDARRAGGRARGPNRPQPRGRRPATARKPPGAAGARRPRPPACPRRSAPKRSAG